MSDTWQLLPQPQQMWVRVIFSPAILSNNLLFISSISSKPGHRERKCQNSDWNSAIWRIPMTRLLKYTCSGPWGAHRGLTPAVFCDHSLTTRYQTPLVQSCRKPPATAVLTIGTRRCGTQTNVRQSLGSPVSSDSLCEVWEILSNLTLQSGLSENAYKIFKDHWLR